MFFVVALLLKFSCYYFSVFETNRGPVKRMKFAPGKGNMKLIILFEDGIVLWEGNSVRISLFCIICMILIRHCSFFMPQVGAEEK